jgi:hypothetical protein
MASGITISMQLCLQICTSCDFISFKTGERRTFETASGQAKQQRVNFARRNAEETKPTVGFVNLLKTNYIRVYTGNTRMYCFWTNHIFVIK